MTKHIFLILIVLTFINISCTDERMNKNNQYSIIPQPNQLVPEKGSFELTENTKLFFTDDAKQLRAVSPQFIKELEQETGLKIQEDQRETSNGIIVTTSKVLPSEAYKLQINKSKIQITASSTAGVYYALQTIKQLIPVNSKETKVCLIPAVEISDKPEFDWRGYMLDESRHFFGKEKVKEVLDFMAELKLNRFHWHLTDDQGWRIEIKKYPKLSEVGAWRVDHNVTDENVSNWWGRPVQKEGEKATYGGFYTQEEIKEIIAYAKERHIEILPEIDVPGHSQEILAAYPEVSCEPNRKFYVATGGVARDNAICASNPYTYKFLEDVLGEVMDLFPLDYIHIGGDECNKEGWHNHKLCQDFIKENGLKDEHELQSHLIKQVEKMVNAKGKKLIGWDEILEGGLAPNATVMSWRGEEGGIAAAKAGHDVIMTPNYANYLDLKQGQSDFEPNLGYSEALLSTCYNYKVIPEGFSEVQASKILGLQGNLWTESISDWGKLTYMTYPRLYAVAENGWTSEGNQNFDEFIERLEVQLNKLESRGIRYAKSVFTPWIYHNGDGKSIEISFDSELTSPEIRYSLDGSVPNAQSTLYTEPFTLSETQTIKAAIFKDGKPLGQIIEATYPIHKAAGAKVIYKHPFEKSDEAAKELALTDLNYGQLDVAGDKNWQGFKNKFDVIIELNEPTDINEVQLTSMRQTIGGIYPFKQVIIYGSTNGEKFTKIGDSGFQEACLIQGRNRIVTKVDCAAKALTQIRVKAELLNPIPVGHHRAGGNSYLKIDEIVVL